MTLHRNPAGFLGVLMLDTRFPRVAGDVGNPASFAIPVRHRVVAGASPQRVVRQGDPTLLGPFVDAARQLVDEGARAIATSCGFLVLFQQAMQAALPVPVWTSSLLKLPELQAPGVVTVDVLSLGAAHLHAAGADATVPVAGLAQGCHLQRALLEDLPHIDPQQAEADVVEAAQRLVARWPAVREIVLECTNLPPYAKAVARATRRPVHHIISLLHERWRALEANP
ncbi:MAG TPA: aspartate/glutamate racemase family protein [Burkholderiaceae bacterium]|nr:aspartate/glutamate racemase family protein [Burkholderiaceae bacterium]